MKKTFPSFDSGIDYLFPSDPWKESKRKKNNSPSFACLAVSELDDLVESVQAQTTKYLYATKYAFNYYNKNLKITFAFQTKMYNKIKRELYATDCECEICLKSNFIRRCFAVFWLSNVQKTTIKTWKNAPDSLPE